MRKRRVSGGDELQYRGRMNNNTTSDLSIAFIQASELGRFRRHVLPLSRFGLALCDSFPIGEISPVLLLFNIVVLDH